MPCQSLASAETAKKHHFRPIVVICVVCKILDQVNAFHRGYETAIKQREYSIYQPGLGQIEILEDNGATSLTILLYRLIYKWARNGLIFHFVSIYVVMLYSSLGYLSTLQNCVSSLHRDLIFCFSLCPEADRFHQNLISLFLSFC